MKTYRGFIYTWFKGIECASLLYGDSDRKIVYIMSPRTSCSVSFQFYLKSLNDKLLTDALEYNDFVHRYRSDVHNKYLPKKTIEELMNENYTFVKFVVNPYQRAVSSFRMIFDDKDNKEKYDLTINLNNITSVHHSNRQTEETNISLCNIPRRDINRYLPKNNRKLIEHYYKDDITNDF